MTLYEEVLKKQEERRKAAAVLSAGVILPAGVVPPVASPKVPSVVLPPVVPKVETPRASRAAVMGVVPSSAEKKAEAAESEARKRTYEELKRLSQGSEKKVVLPPVVRTAPAGNRAEVMKGLAGYRPPTSDARISSFDALRGQTEMQSVRDEKWRRTFENAEESAAARAKAGFFGALLPGDMDKYFETVGMTPEKKAMLEASGAYNASRMAGFAAGSLPGTLGGVGVANAALKGIPILAKLGGAGRAAGAARAGVRLAGESLGNIPCHATPYNPR
jgi:hypothetical protein